MTSSIKHTQAQTLIQYSSFFFTTSGWFDDGLFFFFSLWIVFSGRWKVCLFHRSPFSSSFQHLLLCSFHLLSFAFGTGQIKKMEMNLSAGWMCWLTVFTKRQLPPRQKIATSQVAALFLKSIMCEDTLRLHWNLNCSFFYKGCQWRVISKITDTNRVLDCRKSRMLTDTEETHIHI